MSAPTTTPGGDVRSAQPRAIRLVPRACAVAIQQEILAAAACEGAVVRTPEQMTFQRPLPLLGLALLALPAMACAQEPSTHAGNAWGTLGTAMPATAQLDPRWQEALARISVDDDDWGLSATEWTDLAAVQIERMAAARTVTVLAADESSPNAAWRSDASADAIASDVAATALPLRQSSKSTYGSDSVGAPRARSVAALDAHDGAGTRPANIRAVAVHAARKSSFMPASSADAAEDRPASTVAVAMRTQSDGSHARAVESRRHQSHISEPELPRSDMPLPPLPQFPVGAEPNGVALRRRPAIEILDPLASAALRKRPTSARPASRNAAYCDVSQPASATEAETKAAAETGAGAETHVADTPQASGTLVAEAVALDTMAGAASSLPLRAYRYIPSVTEFEEVVQRPPEEQRLMDLNRDGEYPRLAREGNTLIEQRGKAGQAVDDQLRLIVANALAWSGQLNAAERQYRQLASGAFALDAKVAMANILHWRGKDDQALPLYQEVLASMPNHAEALNAVARSEASMRPRTRIGLQGSRDSDDVMVRTLTANHVMRTHDAKRVWEFDLHAMRDKSPFAKDLQSGLSVRHQRLDWRMRPTFELGVADTLYGSVSVTPTRWPVVATAGRVNWAQMSYNPRALQKGMAAWNVGVRASADGRLGRVNLVADAYRVDDGNTATTAMVRYQPALRLPFAIRPVTGFEHRKTSFNTVDYWSPHEGYGLVFAGLEREWARGDRWQLNASVQRGWRVYGEAGSSWGAGLSGRVRIGKQWALGGNAWGVNNSRSNRPYRARSVTVFLEKRW